MFHSYKYNSNCFQCGDLFCKKYEGLYPKVEAFCDLSLRSGPYQRVIREMMDSDGDVLVLKKNLDSYKRVHKYYKTVLSEGHPKMVALIEEIKTRKYVGEEYSGILLKRSRSF